MKSLLRFVVISGLVLSFSTSTLWAQSAPGAPMKPLTPEEQVRREQAKKDCNAYLDRFATNAWVNETKTEAGIFKSELSFQRTLNNQFLQGSYIVRDASGKTTFESMMILTFNWGVGQYLIYSFESDGWSRMFLGEPSADRVLVQGVSPSGMEHYRWTLTPEGNLERAFWKASKDVKITDNPPDEILLFTPVKPAKK